jgi:tetratricopeptide (TPR) repeat protein
VLQYSGEGPDQTVWVPGMVLNHYPDNTKPRAQYLPLLELSAQENPEDDRTAFWLGREYMYRGMHDKCIDALKRHLAMPSAGWDEERSASMRFIAKSYQSKGDNRQAKQWLFRAIAECPRVREPYLQMATMGYLENNWPLTFLMVEKGLSITQRSGSYLHDPSSWGYSFYDLGAISCYRLGLFAKSFAYAQTACDMEPGNQRLKSNLELIRLKVENK